MKSSFAKALFFSLKISECLIPGAVVLFFLNSCSSSQDETNSETCAEIITIADSTTRLDSDASILLKSNNILMQLYYYQILIDQSLPQHTDDQLTKHTLAIICANCRYLKSLKVNPLPLALHSHIQGSQYASIANSVGISIPVFHSKKNLSCSSSNAVALKSNIFSLARRYSDFFLLDEENCTRIRDGFIRKIQSSLENKDTSFNTNQDYYLKILESLNIISHSEIQSFTYFRRTIDSDQVSVAAVSFEQRTKKTQMQIVFVHNKIGNSFERIDDKALNGRISKLLDRTKTYVGFLKKVSLRKLMRN